MAKDKELQICFTVSKEVVERFFDNRSDSEDLFNPYNNDEFFKQEIEKYFERMVRNDDSPDGTNFDIMGLCKDISNLSLQKLRESFLQSLKHTLYNLWVEYFVRTEGMPLDISNEIVRFFSIDIIRRTIREVVGNTRCILADLQTFFDDIDE